VKESNLFDLFVTWKSPKPSCVLSCFWCVVGKFSMNKDVSSWFHNISTYNEEVIETIFSLKFHLSKKIIMEFRHIFVIVKKLSIHRI